MNQTTLYDTRQAAAYLGFSDRTLANSRCSGLLGGLQAPKYRKLGKSIRYESTSLDEWLNQFREQTNTSQNSNDAT